MEPQSEMNLSERISSSILQDEELAKRVIEYYTFMAERGNANAQYALGLILLNGEGTDEDYQIGLSWIEEAALQGHSEAIELYNDEMTPDTDARYDAYI